MERLWSPWRHEYIEAAGKNMSQNPVCIFCEALKNPADDEKNFVLLRAPNNFVILNRYPYISGHLMIAPNAHVSEFASAPKDATDEMMDLAKRCQSGLRQAYDPDGFNLGMNLGQAGGAGVADHFHLHVMPRWSGDTNFMSTVSETRVLPEDLATTYRKLFGKI